MDAIDRTSTGPWSSLARAVDKPGQPLDCLWTARRAERAAQRLLTKAIRCHGGPETLPSDGRAAKAAAIKSAKAAPGPARAIRPSNDLNTMVEHEHQVGQRGTRPMPGCTACGAAQCPLAGVERRPRSKRRQLVVEEGAEGHTAAEPCYALAASSPHRPGQLTSHRLHTKIGDRTLQGAPRRHGCCRSGPCQRGLLAQRALGLDMCRRMG